VANDGTIHVYDIEDGHRELKTISTVAGVGDVRGACASAATGTLYFSHQRADAGAVVAVGLEDDRVLWTHDYQPNVDRLSCSHDGKKLYVPSNEAFPDDSLIVVDAASGAELHRIHVAPRPHDSLDSLSGSRVYIETKSTNVVAVVDTQTDAIIGRIGPFAGIVGPYVVDGRDTRLYANVFGVNGFQVADLATGSVVATASIPGQTAVPNALDQHGIALSADEGEVWVTDGVGNEPVVHVFDVTVSPPAPKRDVAIEYAGAHWITFSIAGDFAYVAGPKLGGRGTDVIDTKTYTRVATLAASEDLFEVDIEAGAVRQVGNQYGVGRRRP
jgi:hypothetical protein